MNITKPIRIELPTGLPVGPVNVYLFRDPEPVLIDTGLKSSDSWIALQRVLSDLQLTVADLREVIITHPHVDHFGMAGQILANSDAQVRISNLGLPAVLDFLGLWEERVIYYREVFLPRVGISRDLIEIIISGMKAIAQKSDQIPEKRAKIFYPGDTLEMGGLSWQVIYTPGHTDAQTCFFQPDTGQFISADMLLPKTTAPVVEHKPGTRERIPGLPKFMESLNLVGSLDISIAFPGHGDPFQSHQQVIRAQKNRIQMRKMECYHLIEEGCETVYQLVNKMYPGHYPQPHLAGIWMLVGYLDLLKIEEKVVEDVDRGVWHYHTRSIT